MLDSATNDNASYSLAQRPSLLGLLFSLFIQLREVLGQQTTHPIMFIIIHKTMENENASTRASLFVREAR